MQSSYSNHCGNTSVDYEYAGFWVRLAAYLLDSIVVFFALLIVRLVLSGVLAAVKGTVLGGNILFQYDLKDIILYIAEALYFILCTYYTGTTLGKKAMNLQVIPAGREGRLGLLTVIYRETAGRFLSGVIMGVGYFMIGIDREKRGIHDILCDTRVVYGKKIKVFRIEKVFTPLAEPMGRVPAPEEMPRTYAMQKGDTQPYAAAEEKSQAYAGRAETGTKQAPLTGEMSEKVPAAAHMPWDGPYISPEESSYPDAAKAAEAIRKPGIPAVPKEGQEPAAQTVPKEDKEPDMSTMPEEDQPEDAREPDV